MTHHYDNRTIRTRIEKRRRRRKLLLLIALSLLGIVLALIWWMFTQQPSAVSQHKPAVSHQLSQSSSEIKQKVSKEPANPDESITWVRQTEPVKLPILMYHAIHVMDPTEAANANLIVSPDVFKSHLEALKQAGYYSLSPAEAYKVLTENVLPKGKKVIWLTFDDSLRDFYTHAFPLLQEYHMKATNNVITGFVENEREDMLTLPQMIEMKEKGLSFEDHTVNHPDLALSSPDIQEKELENSKTYLDQQLQQTTSTVAYPSGRYTETTITIAEKLGYKLGLTTNPGLASLDNGLLSLNRIRIMPTTTAEELLREIAVP
ncbi:polysaccharide deacetylase family protein [Streptococcus himalayensis]|uniref:Deacetylase n=1 Tax=Streptococcus himalayensis TaxID=1888195 RepID=A0A917A7L4_9STRE|nr:polysaccharide deacetylase family protein [Streptococcus himalayensis]GGE33028.1 deacetylase [Streptococcus himalayensis]